MKFVHVDYPTQHGAVLRLERTADVIRNTTRRFDGARGAATMLLAAIASALLVVANELVQTWTDGHLMAAWVALWAIGFAGLALFATPVRAATMRVRNSLRAAAVVRREAAEDAKLWKVAQNDARVMADLSRAMERAGRDLRKMY
ncbi:hypothetical protein [Ramlibacter sp.]|uniref:hypothetical protein n=1 Tax=Ramlibacter sp. TaxID=1917967 RepID=UPI003D0DCE0E